MTIVIKSVVCIIIAMEKKNTNNKTLAISYSALFAALTCVSTMVIQIPTPQGGYVNPGDCFVLLSGFMLSPFYAASAAGIGSMLADILSGYAFYAPATFVIKALMALCAHFSFRLLSNGKESLRFIYISISSLLSEIIMITGYFVYEFVFLNLGAGAFASIIGNVIQGIFAVVVATIFYTLLSSNKSFNNYFNKLK